MARKVGVTVTHPLLLDREKEGHWQKLEELVEQIEGLSDDTPATE